MKCCRCEREIDGSAKMDKYLNAPACKICRLKIEIISSPTLHFGVDLATGESFTTKILWSASESEVLAENYSAV